MPSSADIVYLALFALAAVLAWAALREGVLLWRKIVALVALALMIPVGLAATGELLGRPKPVGSEWLFDLSRPVVVVGVVLREGRAIYLWVRRPGEDVPTAYALPWSEQTAQKIQEAKQTADALQTRLMATLQKKKPVDEAAPRFEPKFYPEPQQALPLKPPPDDQSQGLYIDQTGQ